MSISFRIVVGLTILLTLMSTLSLGQATPPSADTYASSAFPKYNFGSGIILIVQSGVTSYVRFNLNTLPPGVTVTKATLRLYVDGVAAKGSFDIYQLNDSWNESTLTYNTPPPPLGASATGGHPISITTSSMNQFLLIDVTSLVQGWLNGTIANNGIALALTTGSNGSFSFDSKESLLTGNGPELEIALAGAVGPQGPQGPAGPAGAQGSQGPAGPKGDTGAIGAQGPIGQTGPQGLQGPMGLTGAQGAQGDPGPAGSQGTAGQGFNFRAAFDGSATYAPYDVVSYNGSSYNAKVATNPGDPTPDVNPNWSLMAQQGAPGAQGPAGAQGAQGPLGPIGPMGFQGPQGPPGVAPPNTAVTNASNTFAASQTVNGNLILGAGGAIQFADGTTQNTSASGGSGTCSSFEITSSSPVVPAGYVPVSTVTAGNVWFFMAPMPTGRRSLAAVTLNGKIYAIGGQGGSGLLNTVEVYDPSANTWSTAPPMPTARNYFAAAAVNGKIYAIGGELSTGGVLNIVEVFDPTANTWSTAVSMPTARDGLTAAVANGKIYAIGGYNGVILNTVEVYDPSVNAWSTAPSMPTARAILAAGAVNGKIYAMGGTTDNNGTYVNTVEVFDSSTSKWSSTRPMPTAREDLAAAVANGKIYAIGGDNPGILNTVEVFDPATSFWSTAAPLNTAETYLAATDNNGLVYAIGGSSGTYSNAVEQYSPAVTLYTFLKN
jgi:N-acetylneuraminic acid mutarotase